MTRRPAESRRDVLVLAGLLAAGGLGAVLGRRMAPVGTDIGRTPVVAAILADAAAPAGGNLRGDVTIHVWTDFNCPACRRAHEAMMAAATADAGTRILFRDWPIFGEDSRQAAMLAIAADAQGLYLPVHRQLMRGGRANAGAAEAAVAAAGGSVERLYRDLAERQAAIAGMLARHANEAFALGLGGTPGHLIGTILARGALGEGQFRRAIRQARAAAG